MQSRLLVSSLLRSLPPLPPSPAPPCLLCVEGRQHATPHSSSFPPTTAALQTLHSDVWGPARVSGLGLRLQLRERFRQDLLVLRLHSDRGVEFSSDLLRDFCHGEGILQSFTLPASLQQNGIAERRIGLVMEVARTSMIHAAAPRFLWPFVVRYAAHQLNLWPRVSFPETSPTLHWMGKFGDASVFRFYHPTFRRVLPSQDVTFDESVPFYRLFPYRSAPLPPPLLFLVPGPPPVAVDSSAASGGAKSGGAASGGAKTARAEPGGAKPTGAEPGGAESEGAGSGVVEPGVAEPWGIEPSEGAESGGAEPRGTASSGGPAGASPRLSPRPEPLSPQQMHEWFARRTRLRSGAAGAGDSAAGGTGAGGFRATSAGGAGPGGACSRGTGAVEAGGAGGAGAGDPGAGGAGPGGTGASGPGGTRAARAGGTRAAGPGGARTGGTGAAGAGGAAGVGAGGTGARAAGGTRAAGAGGAACVGAGGIRAGGAGPGGSWSPLLCPPRDHSQPSLQPASPLPAASPYTGQTGGLRERRELMSRPALPVCAIRTGHCVPRPRPPPIPGTHHMALRPSSVPQHVPLTSPPASSLADGPTINPTVPRLLATFVTDPSFESIAASALVVELFDFAAACRLDYSASLVAESKSDCPPSIGGECALGTDVLEDRQEDIEYFAAVVPHFVSMTVMDEMASLKSTCTYVDAVPPPRANIVDGMWIFRVKGPSGSPPAFKARCLHEEIWLRRPPGFTGSFPAGTHWSLRRPVYGLHQAPREWQDTLRTTLAALGFAPSTADSSLFLHTETSLPPFYVLVYVDDLVFATAYTEGLALVKSELQKRHPCTDSTPLPTGHSLSTPPSDEFVEPSGLYPELVGCLMYLMTCTRPGLAYRLSILARYVVLGRHRPEHWEAVKRVLRYLFSTSGMGLVLGGRGPVVLTGHTDASWVDDLETQRLPGSCCEAEIYTRAMAAMELRWLSYLLADLGERPCSSPVLYIDNKAMIALCQEHRTKHIALGYFLARELQQRGQLRLVYVATRANTADISTNTLQSGDHQRFRTVLGHLPTLPHLLTA
ncbi:unnamed protein product [Closterium sp. NIES-54]